MNPITTPDLSARPYQFTVEKLMSAAPETLFLAWTKQWDRWFAAPGTVLVQGEPDTTFFFETVHQERRHPHYGRYLRLQPNRLVELTWLTRGTQGVETVVRVELEEREAGTLLRLTHAGFPDEASQHAHEQAWPSVLEQLEHRTATDS